MKTWNNVFSSAVFRLIVIVLAVVIPLNLLTLILGSTVIGEVERQFSLETQNALQLYMSQLDDSLRRINIRMYTLAHNDVNFSRLNDKEITDTDEWQIQAVVSLNNTMDDILDDHALIGGIYAWFPEKNYYVGQGGTAQQSETVKGYVLDAVGGQYEAYGSWSMVMAKEIPTCCGSPAAGRPTTERGSACGRWPIRWDCLTTGTALSRHLPTGREPSIRPAGTTFGVWTSMSPASDTTAKAVRW